MSPFHDLKVKTLTSNNTYGVDIEGFDMAGVPTFQLVTGPTRASDQSVVSDSYSIVRRNAGPSSRIRYLFMRSRPMIAYSIGIAITAKLLIAMCSSSSRSVR